MAHQAVPWRTDSYCQYYYCYHTVQQDSRCMHDRYRRWFKTNQAPVINAVLHFREAFLCLKSSDDNKLLIFIRFIALQLYRPRTPCARCGKRMCIRKQSRDCCKARSDVPGCPILRGNQARFKLQTCHMHGRGQLLLPVAAFAHNGSARTAAWNLTALSSH